MYLLQTTACSKKINLLILEPVCGMKNVHLPEKLSKIRTSSSFDPFAAAQAILAERDQRDEELAEHLDQPHQSADFIPEELDPERLYHIDHIQQLATKYRLRFLESARFKGEIPHQALAVMNRLEGKTPSGNYFILAPESLFVLDEKDKDPLLFMKLSQTSYYLVHQWGNDLHPLRSLLVWPTRNFKNLLICILALALLISTTFPEQWMGVPAGGPTWTMRGILFFYSLFGISALTALYGFSRMRDFSTNLWNSPYTD